MTSTVALTLDEHMPIMWPLRNFLLGSFSPTGQCELQLDRGNHEFGLLYRLDPSAALMAQYADNDDPVTFSASWAMAACHRPNGSCKKVTVLLPNHQVDLEFEDANHAQTFIATLKSLATNAFTIYEVPMNIAFQRKEFNMAKLGYRASNLQNWSVVADPMAMSTVRLWKTGEWSDFVVIAGNKSFKVHKTIICPRSDFFANACKPVFAEGAEGHIRLEEDDSTVEAMLTEIYGVENAITGSVFTTFALKHDFEKETLMSTLLKLFIASDKYNLSAIRLRAAEAFIDRVRLINDHLILLDLAINIYDCCPANDLGLRCTIIGLLMARFPAIHKDNAAKEVLQQNTAVLDAVHSRFSDLIEQGEISISTESSSLMLTPPTTPTKNRKTAT